MPSLIGLSQRQSEASIVPEQALQCTQACMQKHMMTTNMHKHILLAHEPYTVVQTSMHTWEHASCAAARKVLLLSTPYHIILYIYIGAVDPTSE